MQAFGVHGEVGKLRTVLVCRPGLAHPRLTPGNAAELLFDDVLRVQEAQKDHADFVMKMREREVLDLPRSEWSAMLETAFGSRSGSSRATPPRA